MGAEALDSVLDAPFQTVDASDASAVEGLGLSLYAANRMLTLCGGALDIASELGAGTVATVRLPVDTST
jgi:signal transduction histidine kinase